ncbi:MAG: GTPase HflX [Ignavibacteria bacterium]|nr:GTPase HflX [Ignavibacteria bacterium]
MVENSIAPEKTLLVAVPRKGTEKEVIEEHLEELALLVDTAGGEVVDYISQELSTPYPATAIGKGKVQEIKQLINDKNITLIVFDDDLSPVQLKNLETEFQVKVIDRTTLILSIFAQNARTLEAKTQVELAQLQYMLPRLTKLWTHLSKQYGGIGTRGPGEKQIETDRRLLKERIQKLKKKLLDIAKQKEVERKARDEFFKFSFVGYTNAGKSTLMRALTESDVFVANKLFATLDTTTRALRLPNGKIVLLSDTVGFIRKLPAHLVASFRSTLAEVSYAEALIHVADASHRFLSEQIQVVDETLESLNLNQKPRILVLNKIDLIKDKEYIRDLQRRYPDAILISAERGINLNSLLEKMITIMEKETDFVCLLLPYNRLELMQYVYDLSDVIEKVETENGIEFRTRPLQKNKKYFTYLFQRFILS